MPAWVKYVRTRKHARQSLIAPQKLISLPRDPDETLISDQGRSSKRINVNDEQLGSTRHTLGNDCKHLLCGQFFAVATHLRMTADHECKVDGETCGV
jgi:hypothetical protein